MMVNQQKFAKETRAFLYSLVVYILINWTMQMIDLDMKFPRYFLKDHDTSTQKMPNVKKFIQKFESREISNGLTIFLTAGNILHIIRSCLIFPMNIPIRRSIFLKLEFQTTPLSLESAIHFLEYLSPYYCNFQINFTSYSYQIPIPVWNMKPFHQYKILLELAQIAPPLFHSSLQPRIPLFFFEKKNDRSSSPHHSSSYRNWGSFCNKLSISLNARLIPTFSSTVRHD